MTRARKLAMLHAMEQTTIHSISTNFHQVKALLTVGEVGQIVNLSRATIYRLMKKNAFPRPVHVTAHAVRWRTVDIYRWLESRRY